MNKSRLKNLILVFSLILMAAVLLVPAKKVYAASEVSIGEIDYEALSMKVYKNGNGIVYFSTDNKKTWNEVEGITYTDSDGTFILADISWASSTVDTKVQFKGNVVSSVVSIVLPKQSSTFKAKFDAINNSFEFSGQDDATTFLWRKNTDYNWSEVSFDESSASYQIFLAEISTLRFKGAKIILRTGQVKGTDAEDVGERPGRECTVTIGKLATAPSVKLNVQKLTLNTKTTMEYRMGPNDEWETCEANAKVEDIIPSVLFEYGGNSVTLLVRNAATEKKAASLTALITVPGQKRGPNVGSGSSSEVCAEYKNNKYEITFRNASATKVYEYCIIKPDKEFDVHTAAWKTVKSTKTIKLSKTAAPEGSYIYVRYKGVQENTTKGIAMELPSAVTAYPVF